MNKSSYVYEYDIIKISNMPEFAYLFMTQGMKSKFLSVVHGWNS